MSTAYMVCHLGFKRTSDMAGHRVHLEDIRKHCRPAAAHLVKELLFFSGGRCRWVGLISRRPLPLHKPGEVILEVLLFCGVMAAGVRHAAGGGRGKGGAALLEADARPGLGVEGSAAGVGGGRQDGGVLWPCNGYGPSTRPAHARACTAQA